MNPLSKNWIELLRILKNGQSQMHVLPTKLSLKQIFHPFHDI